MKGKTLMQEQQDQIMFRNTYAPQPIKQQSQQKLQQVYERKPFSFIAEDSKHNQNIQEMVQQLNKHYDGYRPIRGDGNCYFRAVGYAFLEHLIRRTTQEKYLLEIIKKFSEANGYFKIREGCHSVRNQFIEFLNILLQLKINGEIKKAFSFLEDAIANNVDQIDECLVWEMRQITANYLEIHQSYFSEFNSEPYQQSLFKILQMGKEAESLGIGPVEVILKIKLQIVMIDRRYSQAVDFQQYNINGVLPIIYILYKPGHYDLIYSRPQSLVDGFSEELGWSANEEDLQGYDINSPGEPFFINVITTEGIAPYEENPRKTSQLVNIPHSVNFSMQSSNLSNLQKELMQSQTNVFQKSSQIVRGQIFQQEQPLENQKSLQCIKCQKQLDKVAFIKNKLCHPICKICYLQYLQKNTNKKYFCLPQEKGYNLKSICNCFILQESEIEEILGENAMKICRQKYYERMKNSDCSQCENKSCNQQFLSQFKITLECQHLLCPQCIKKIQQRANTSQPYSCLICKCVMGQKQIQQIEKVLNQRYSQNN